MKQKKYFIITIDTEGDNLWEWKQGDIITTENTRYLNRFQEVSNKYGFKPVWLSNYEMIADDRYVEFIKSVEKRKLGELGMHLHAWSTPPEYALNTEGGAQPYLIEYPEEIMESKIKTMTTFIQDRTGITPVSHRSGRWAMDERYVKLLDKYGYMVDCSVTPHISWVNHKGLSEGSAGSDYSLSPEKPYYLTDRVLEIPVTIRKIHHVFKPSYCNARKILSHVYRGVVGQNIWLRPNGNNINELLYLIDLAKESDSDYVMFMLHSSELMPGGSPTFKTQDSINKLYDDLEKLFSYASQYYTGITLRDYSSLIIQKRIKNEC